MAASEISFGVMGGTAHVVVVADDPAPLLDHGRRRLAGLEALWTRFASASEVSALNRAGGRATALSGETLVLMARSVDAWRLTGGAFDPTVLPAVVGAGYVDGLNRAGDGAGPAPGCAGIVVDAASGLVTLPEGVSFDPGGIGKGLAADIVAEELLELGAEGALVNVGGDLRAVGSAPGSDGWVVAIEDPFDESATIAAPRLHEGAVATTTPDHRRWVTPDGRPGRHVIDPFTGTPTVTDVASATVIAAQAWMAEALAKAAALAGFADAVDIIDEVGLSGIIVSDQGAMALSARFGAFL